MSSPHVLENCELVIDGDSFFRDTHKKSGCQFILGPDCNQYAEFIIKSLRLFIEKEVKCYVVFSGTRKHDISKLKEFHQHTLDDRNDIARIDMAAYFQPLLITDVQKQVLEQMDIKYFVCEYDSLGAIVGVAKKLKCPVLTNNVEYSCYGVSCIAPNSVEQDKYTTKLMCTIYEHEKVKTTIGVYNKMPILLALLSESGDYLEKLGEIIEEDCDVIWPVIRWVKRQKEATIISTVSRSIDDKKENKVFKEVYEKIQLIYTFPLSNLAVKYFQRDRAHGLFKDDKKWFAKGVSNSRIAVPYINLKKNGVICGSLIMNDCKRPDALLAAVDIIAYSHCLLKNSQDSTINFLGREGKKCSVKKIVTHWDKETSNRDIFTKHRVSKKLKLLTKESNPFEQFLEEVLPGYDYKKPLDNVSEECKILIITLVYYVVKKNKDFIKGAYCVLLSYLMLGPVSRIVENLKLNGPSITISSTAKDAESFYNGLKFLFEKVDLRVKYNTTIVHNLSEFQHCLQHMNYLNKLCGEKIPCTVYHGTFNATFIYNTFLLVDNKDELMEYLGYRFSGSKCLEIFKDLVAAFENCLSVAKVFATNNNVKTDSVDQNMNSVPSNSDGESINVVDGESMDVYSVDKEKIVQNESVENSHVSLRTICSNDHIIIESLF